MAFKKLTQQEANFQPLPLPPALTPNGRGLLGVPKAEIVWTSADSEVPREVAIFTDDKGHRTYPIERATGRPLPVVIDRLGNRPNRHHAFYYERYYKNGPAGRKMARRASLQLVNRRDHTVIHDEYEGGTPFPYDEAQEFNQTIWGMVGYIPPFGVRVRNGEAVVVELSPKDKRKLRKPGIFSIEKHDKRLTDKLADYLLGYSVAQQFEPKREIWIEEFLSISEDAAFLKPDLRRRREILGMKLTNAAIGAAVDPIAPVFDEARKTHSLKEPKRALPPKSAWEAVKSSVQGREPLHFGELKHHLARRYLGETAMAA